MGREGVGQHARQRQNAKPGMRKIYHNNALHPQLHSVYYVKIINLHPSTPMKSSLTFQN